MLVGFSFVFLFFGFPVGALCILGMWAAILISFCHVGAGQRIKGGKIHFALLSAILTALLAPFSFDTLGPFAMAYVVVLLTLYITIYANWYHRKEVTLNKAHSLEFFLWALPVLTFVLSINLYFGYMAYAFS